MADVVEMVLRIDTAQAGSAMAATATSVRQLVDSEAALARQERETAAGAEAQAAALYRLQTVAAALAGPTQAASLAFQRQAQTIHELGKASGDTALAEQALSDLVQRRAAAVSGAAFSTEAAAAGAARAATAQRALAASGDEATRAANATRYGFINLGNQLSDVASQLATGTNPLTILVQQGPQAALALSQVGGAGAAATTALGALAGLAPVLAGTAVAAGAAGTGWVLLQNAQLDAATSADVVDAALIKAAAQIPLTGDAVAKLAEHWRTLSADLDEAKGKLDVINGAVSAGDNARAQAVREVTEASREALLEEAKRVTVLREAYAAAEELSRSETASTADRIAARESYLALAPQVSAASAALDAHKAQVRDLAAAQGDAAEYAATMAEANKATADASRDAAAAAKEQAKAVRDAAAALRDFHAAGSDKGPVGASAISDAMAAAEEAIRLSRLSGIDAAAYAAGNPAGAAGAQRAALNQAQANSAAFYAQQDAAAQGGITAGGVATAAGAASSASGVLSAVAATSPQAGAVVAVAQAVANLPQTVQGLLDFSKSLVAGISSLPQVIPQLVIGLAKDLPVALIKAVPELVRGLIFSIPEIVIALVDALVIEIPRAGAAMIAELLDPQTWAEAARAFVEGIVTGPFSTAQARAEADAQAHGGGTFGDLVRAGVLPNIGGLGTHASSSNSSASRTVHQHFYSPFVGLGPSSSRDIAGELAANAATYGAA